MKRLSLADAISLAQGRRSEAAQARIDIALADIEVLRAALHRVHLAIDASYSDGYQRLNIGAPADACAALPGACGAATHEQLFVSTASLTVPIWSGLAVEAMWSRANRLVDAAEARRLSTWRSIRLEAATAYWAVRRADLLVQTNLKAHERSAQVVAITKARADAGISPVVDYLRAQSSMLIESAATRDLEGQLNEAKAALASALQIDEGVILTEQPADGSPALPPLAGVLADAERRRPEVIAAQASYEAQIAQARVTAGGFWPQVSLYGLADARNQLLGIPESTIIGSFSAGVKVDWQIFDSLSTYTAYRQERLTADKLAEDRKRTVYVVRAEVESAYARMKAAVDRREALKEALELVRSGMDLIERRYQAGTSLLIEVLDAQSQLQQVELSLVNSAVDISLLRVALDAARGVL